MDNSGNCVTRLSVVRLWNFEAATVLLFPFNPFHYKGNISCLLHVECLTSYNWLAQYSWATKIKPSLAFFNTPDLKQLRLVLSDFPSIFFKYWPCICLFFQVTNQFSVVSFMYSAFTSLFLRVFLHWFLSAGILAFS